MSGCADKASEWANRPGRLAHAQKICRCVGAAVTIVLLVSVGASQVAYSSSGSYRGFPTVQLYADGAKVAADVPPIVVDGRTLVPIRAVSEALGKRVWWHPELRAVYVGKAPIIAGQGVPPDAIDEAQEASLKAWDAVESYFGESGEHPFVFLHSNEQEWYERLLADGQPEALAKKVVRYAVGSAGAYVDLLWPKASKLELVCAHEFGHVALRRSGLSKGMPRWFEEGLVEYAARELAGYSPDSPRGGFLWASDREEVLSKAKEGTLEPLAKSPGEWAALLGEYPVHAQSLLAFDLLVRRSVQGSAKLYLSYRASGKEHAEAFVAAFGSDPASFEREFLAYLKDEATKKQAGVRVKLQLPERFSGSLCVFPPGGRQSDAWRVEGGSAVEVMLKPNGLVDTNLTARLSTRYRLTGGEPAEDLLLFLVPKEGLIAKEGEKRLKDLCAVFRCTSYDWYWSHNVAFWEDGSSDINGEDPGYPVGLRLLEVNSMREPEG